MFGIGLPELAVIAFFGVVLLGPDKLPGLAKQLAQGIKAARRMGDSVRDDLRSSLGEEYSDLELRDLHPRALVRRQIEEILAERDEDEDDADDPHADDDPSPVGADAPQHSPHATPRAAPVERKTA